MSRNLLLPRDSNREEGICVTLDHRAIEFVPDVSPRSERDLRDESRFSSSDHPAQLTTSGEDEVEAMKVKLPRRVKIKRLTWRPFSVPSKFFLKILVNLLASDFSHNATRFIRPTANSRKLSPRAKFFSSAAHIMTREGKQTFNVRLIQLCDRR